VSSKRKRYDDESSGSEDDPVEVSFAVGDWMPTLEYAEMLRQLQVTVTDVPNTVIEDYEPSDEGWGVVIGPLIRPEHRPQPKQADERDAGAPADKSDSE
jgi:hypothetical protein